MTDIYLGKQIFKETFVNKPMEFQFPARNIRSRDRPFILNGLKSVSCGWSIVYKMMMFSVFLVITNGENIVGGYAFVSQVFRAWNKT